MPLRIAALFLSLLLCNSVLAESTPHWLEIKTDHFLVITDGSDGQARHVAAQFERMHALFAKLLPGARDENGRVVVLAFRSQKGFGAVEPAAYLQKNSLNLAGLFLSRPDKSFILLRLDTSGEHPYETVYHEYTHYMVRHATSLPLWLNEGLAQFYGNTDLDQTTARTGQPSANSLLFLRQEKLIPLEALFAVGYDSPYYHEESKGNIFYAESWALTHYLLIQDYAKHTDKMQEYGHRVSSGESAVQAARAVFGDLNALAKDLQGYVNNGQYMMLKTPLQNTVKEASFDVQALPEAEADALRAEVLVEDGRKDEGKALIASVLQRAPDNPDAHESMGLLELREGHTAEARRWFGEAVALQATGYVPYYYFGSLSMQLDDETAGAKSSEGIAESLAKAVELNPTFAPAVEALALFDAQHEHTDDASHLMARAVELEPGDIDYRLNAASMRMQRGDWTSALAILKAADKVAQKPADHERIQERMESVGRYQQQLAERNGESSSGEAMLRPASAPGADGLRGNPVNRAVVSNAHGQVLTPITPAGGPHTFPTPSLNAAKHTVKGVMHDVSCFYPKGLTMEVEGALKATSLFSNDMYAIEFTALNFTPKKELNPCVEFEGMKASVVYAEVEGQAVAGQIVSVALSR